MPDEDESKTGQALGLVIVGGVISLIGSANYRGEVHEAVDIYNRNLKANSMSHAGSFRKAKTNPSFLFGLAPATSNSQAMMTVGMNLQF